MLAVYIKERQRGDTIRLSKIQLKDQILVGFILADIGRHDMEAFSRQRVARHSYIMSSSAISAVNLVLKYCGQLLITVTLTRFHLFQCSICENSSR